MKEWLFCSLLAGSFYCFWPTIDTYYYRHSPKVFTEHGFHGELQYKCVVTNYKINLWKLKDSKTCYVLMNSTWFEDLVDNGE